MEKKKGINVAGLAIGLVVVCLVAIVAVLGTKAMKGNKEEDTTTTTLSVYQTEYYDQTSVFEETSSIIEDLSETISTTLENISTTVASSVAETTSKVTSTKATTTEKVTVVTINSEETEVGKSSENSVAASSDWKNLPYDMTLAGLSKSGYKVIGLKQYIYNDDMADDCSQRNLGYNSFYDAGASLIDFSIDTVKLKFNYSGKTYRFQLWKGQYISGSIGTVGGEVGIYTHNGENFNGDHFDCAGKGDELYMETTILFDENQDGNYIPQLTRNYSLHWWQTGYVDGQLPNKRDSSPLRILTRITFKDETQAKGFESALLNKGFTKVDTFDPTVPDTYKRYGKDIIFEWWNIR